MMIRITSHLESVEVGYAWYIPDIVAGKWGNARAAADAALTQCCLDCDCFNVVAVETPEKYELVNKPAGRALFLSLMANREYPLDI